MRRGSEPPIKTLRGVTTAAFLALALRAGFDHGDRIRLSDTSAWIVLEITIGLRVFH